MIIRSSSFSDMGMIPQKHTGFGEDVSPEFTIIDQPEKTVSLVLSLDDLDVPFCKAFNHWIVWNIPKTEIIPQGLPKGAVILDPVYACQGKAWGKHCYRGPKQPVFIRKEHRYVFTVYALDCKLNLPETSCKQDVVEAMRGHILDKAVITGIYHSL